MTKEQYESLQGNPILSLNKEINGVKTSEILKLITNDTQGEILEVEPIYCSSDKFWVRYEYVVA